MINVLSIRQLFRYRALIEVLVSRDLKARYRGTWLGFLWSLANPLLMMLIYSLIFSVYMRIEQPHYAVFLLTALLPWTCFATSIVEGMNALLNNSNIIKKVQLPLAVFPLVASTSQMIHLLLGLPILFGFLWWEGIGFSWHIAWLPMLLLLQWLFTLGLNLLAASFTIQFRDLQHILPNLVMIWFYLTPVLYNQQMVPAHMAYLLELNPMAWLMESYRQVLFFQQSPPLVWLLRLTLVSLTMVLLGYSVFEHRRELHPELC